MKQLFTFVLAAMAFVACTQNDVEELSANRADVPETLTVGFEGGDTRIELNEALKTVWTEGDEVSVFYRSYENTRWAFQGETGDRSCELRLVSGEVGAQTMDNSIIVYPYSDSYAIDADTHAVAALLPAVQSYKEGSYGAEGNIMVAESKFTQFTLKSIVGWLRVELTGNRHIVNSITLCGNDGEPVAGLCYINAADASVALAASDVDESLVATEVVLNCGSGVMLGAEAKKFYIALLPQTFEKGLTVEVNYANAEPQTLVYEDSITIRRNHISPINIEAQGEAIIRTDKLFYTATALVEPDEATAFNVAIVSNEWDEATGEGVITFNGELTTIGYEAFAYCDSLTSVTIPESVTTIGNNAFYHCTSLTSVTIPESITTIGEAAFRSCDSLTSVTIPDSVTTIGAIAFYYCTSLTSVTIGDSVTTIGEGAFYHCDSLTSVTIPESVTTIGEAVFKDCASLTSVTIPDSVTTIGEAVFKDCASLTSVTIPESVTTIGNNAFWYCGNLTSVTIPESVTTIGDYAFRHCSSLTSVTIPTNTTTIGEGAFVWCESLTSVTIPNNVTTIGNGAFAACISLAEFKGKFAADGGRCLIKDNTIIAYANASGTTYTIGDSVTSIGDYAFHSCSSLTSVTIPESVTTIGDHAFIYCDSLTSVYCKATTPPAGGVGMFYDTSATIYVPEDSLREYKMAENWSEYADYIVGYNFEAGEETPETPSDFVPTHTATKWLWSGPSSYGNKYAVSGDGFTVDVHFPTDVATESSLATGEYVWMVTSFFSNSDATNFTTRSFKLGGSDDTVPISDGSAKVTASGDVYTIQLTLVHRDSGEKYMIEYVGKLNDAGEQGGGEVNPDGAIKLTRFAYDMDMCSHYLGYFWRASGENVSLGVAITSRSCTQDSINAGDYVYNAYPDDIEYAFQLRNSTYNGVSVGDSNSTMKVEKSGEVYKITIVASGHTFVYEGTLN